MHDTLKVRGSAPSSARSFFAPLEQPGASIRSAHAANAGVAPRQRSVSTVSKSGASMRMVWPEAIGMAVEAIEAADFLTREHKADIFYNNAARFLRLPDAPK